MTFIQTGLYVFLKNNLKFFGVIQQFRQDHAISKLFSCSLSLTLTYCSPRTSFCLLRIEEEIWCSFSDNLEEIYWRSFTTRWSKQNHEGSTGNSICLNTGPAGTISLKPPRILKDSKNLLFVLTWEGCTYNVAQRMDTQSARHISISNYYMDQLSSIKNHIKSIKYLVSRSGCKQMHKRAYFWYLKLFPQVFRQHAASL